MTPKFIFTNSKGQSVEFTNDAPLFMKTYHGTGGSPVDIQTQKSPYQDGETLIDTTLEMRDIQLVVAILGTSTAEVMQHRRRLSQVLNPKLGRGKLRFESETGAHEIDVQPNGAPAFPGGKARGALYQECLIELLAPSPFWLDPYFESRELSYLMGGIQFRLKLPTMFSYWGFERRVINDGDVPTPVEIEFKGPAVNPTVSNETTGELIKVNRELQEDEVLNISTAFGQKYVCINGDNAFHYIDLSSVFWQLVPGENLLSYTSNNDSIKTQVTVKWKNRYVGI
ncbi:MAG: phage tail family protein [Christensenellales bacterium]